MIKCPQKKKFKFHSILTSQKQQKSVLYRLTTGIPNLYIILILLVCFNYLVIHSYIDIMMMCRLQISYPNFCEGFYEWSLKFSDIKENCFYLVYSDIFSIIKKTKAVVFRNLRCQSCCATGENFLKWATFRC